MKEFEQYRALVESMIRLDLAENPIQPPRRPSRINTFPMRPPQPPAQQAPKQPLQEYEVPVHTKRGTVYYRRQKVTQLRPGYRAGSASAPQTPTAPRKPTEEELATPQQPSEEFVRRFARQPQAQPAEPPDAMQLAVDEDDSAEMNPDTIRKLIESLHADFMQGMQDTTRVAAFGNEGHLEMYQGHHDNLMWAGSPAYRRALGEIEQALGHPMLLMGLLAGVGGAPTYLESRPGYGKTTMARAMKRRLDALYQRLDKDPSAARQLAEFPFADVLLVEPKTDVSELIGYLYVAGTHDPSRGTEHDSDTEHDSEVVRNLAEHLMETNPGMTPEHARERAQQMTTEAINVMTGGGISGKTAHAPTSAVLTALKRASRWRTPDGKMVKPILLWYDDAHSPGYLEMIRDRLKTSIAANVAYGMPYLRAYHILAANPNDASVSPEFASRLFPVIIPAGASIEFALRGHRGVEERLHSVGRVVARKAVSQVLGKPYKEATQEEIERNKKAIQEKFREELNTDYARYALVPQTRDKVLEKDALDYLSSGLGATHYEDAIGLAINKAGLDALTAGWHTGEDVDEEEIFSTLLQTPGYASAYNKEELRAIAERHAVLSRAIEHNSSSLKHLFTQTGEPRLTRWEPAYAVLDRTGEDGIDWYNERSEAKSGHDTEQPMARTPRDWQRIVDLSAMMLTLGRPDMVLYTIGTTCGIKHEIPMPKITMDSHPADIDKAIASYFTAANLTPSAQERIQKSKMSPEQYIAGLSEFARAAIYTTQLGGGAGEHTIYSITKPHIDTLTQQQRGTMVNNLGTESAYEIPSSYRTTDEILPDVPWHAAHNANLQPNAQPNHLLTTYRFPDSADSTIRREAETAHAILGTLAGLMHSMHATGAVGTQERNAILKSAKHAVEKRQSAMKPILKTVRSASRMAAALRRFAAQPDYSRLSDDDKRELHRFGHLVALAHAKLNNGDYALDEDKRNAIKDMIETIDGIAMTGSQAQTGGAVVGTGQFDPLVHTRWSDKFADALADVLSV